jgi:hypothetical protein
VSQIESLHITSIDGLIGVLSLIPFSCSIIDPDKIEDTKVNIIATVLISRFSPKIRHAHALAIITAVKNTIILFSF